MEHVTSEEQKDQVLLMTLGKVFLLPFVIILILSFGGSIFDVMNDQFDQNKRQNSIGKGNGSIPPFVCIDMNLNSSISRCGIIELLKNLTVQTLFTFVLMIGGFLVLPFTDWKFIILYITVIPLIFFLIYRWEQKKTQKQQTNSV